MKSRFLAPKCHIVGFSATGPGGYILQKISTNTEVEVEVTLRLTVSQSVYLGVRHPFWAHDQIFLFSFCCRKIYLHFVLGRSL
jgi:hypothetical protein